MERDSAQLTRQRSGSTETFSDWIRHSLEEELERSWEIEMNGVGVPEAYAPAAG